MIELLRNVDHGLFALVNQTLAWPPLDDAFVVITHRFFYLGAGLLAAVYLPARYRRAGLYTVIAAAVAVGLADLSVARVLKPLLGRVRPCHAVEGARLLVVQGDTPSFPSSHAANAFAFAFVVLCDYKRAGAALLAVALAVSYSRVYVGVHWPLDVLGGAAWGVFLGVCVVSGRFYLGSFYERWRYLKRAKR